MKLILIMNQKILIEISVNYPFAIWNKFYWHLRSEMKDKFFSTKICFVTFNYNLL